MTLLAAAVAGRGLVDPTEPVFFPDDEALLRGAAAFETVRLRAGKPAFLDRHVARLERSSAALRLPPPDGAAALAKEVVAAAAADEGAVRLFHTGRTLLATVATLPPGLDELRAEGMAIVTLRSGVVPGLLAGVKATSYAANMAAVAHAESVGANDTLWLGEDQTVLELTTSNIWWREGGVLRTPALATGVLPGVTRGAVLELAQIASYRVEEGVFTLDQLLGAHEAFVTSAIREVMPVSSVDGHPITLGPAARDLQARLERISS
jgi:4-amino-4-deoxychorismate lyase